MIRRTQPKSTEPGDAIPAQPKGKLVIGCFKMAATSAMPGQRPKPRRKPRRSGAHQLDLFTNQPGDE
ncbi:hypothetical protein [Azospirillum sp. TSO22-1]|uniref:hypothetical protein n=1 Tax=Azospirillum sp. TSO22-1 TaxID=716789 RepID=UPI000D61DFFC|nr:hypothetical protein [Azospirillum sp. TSO22-1]PWC53266.1 hypothetical protein TSO221_11350 [Azospirillum sp. TSO22-1]